MGVNGRSHNITIHGDTKTLTEWSKCSGVSKACLLARVRRGWLPEELLRNDVPRKHPVMPDVAAKNNTLNSYKQAAKARKLSWELTNEEFFELTKQHCIYCGRAPNTRRYSGVSERGPGCYVYNGIDRVDNNLGYTKSNVVTCCQYCNRAKGNLSYEDFQQWLTDLVKFRSQ